MTDWEIKESPLGLKYANFTDLCKQYCHIGECSSKSQPAIWLGYELSGRLLLSQDMAKQLIILLHKFAFDGHL